MKKCEVCNNEIKNYKSDRFCSKSCARKYSTLNDNKNETKLSKCVKCDKIININKRSSHKNATCDNCRKIKKIIYRQKDIKTQRKIIKDNKIMCGYCGQEICKNKEVCNRYKIIPTLIKYFGFDDSKLGSLDFYKEYYRIVDLIKTEYYENKLSLIELCEKYNHSEVWNFYKILDILDIDRRTLGESTQNALLTGRRNISNTEFNYKNGWHKTWNNKKVYYRSSYELDYCKELDKKKIDYEMETVRIEYWDNKQQKYRIAIPDFYIPFDNLIVEIKCNYSYDEQNMEDKVKKYKELGYNFKLILEHKEILI